MNQSQLVKIKNSLLDLIFPKFCVGCGSDGEYLCSKCQTEIIAVKTQTCPECGKISLGGKYCLGCRGEKPLRGIICGAHYQEGPIRETIHNFKYNHILELKVVLGDLLSNALKENNLGDNLLLVPVPLHFLRRAQRGYNQAELLVEVVSEKLKIPKNCQILRKNRRTKPQVQSEGKKRRNNLKNAFKINKNINLRGKTIILVDDVTTTGTTLDECARVLKSAGAKAVWGLVIARG